MKTHGIKLLLNSVIVLGIALAVRSSEDVLLKFFNVKELMWGELDITGAVSSMIALVVSGPFLWAIFRSRPPLRDSYSEEMMTKLLQLQFGVGIFRFTVGCALLGVLVGIFVPLISLEGLVLFAVAAVFAYLFSYLVEPLYQKIEKRFLSHLTEKERAAIEERAKMAHLAPWEGMLTEFTLSEYSPLAMKNVIESRLRERFGVTIAVIKRAGRVIVAPRGEELLIPKDKLYLIGTDEQLLAAGSVIEKKPTLDEEEFGDDDFGMVALQLDEKHPLVGRTICESGLRESVNGLIVGLERNDERFLNPDPAMQLQADDLIWIVGENELMKQL